MKKKVISLILLLAMVLSVAACGKAKVKLGVYSGMVLTKVTDKEIQEEIDSIIKNKTGCIEVDREVAKGDTVNIDYSGIYYGDISIIVKFELVEGKDTYSFTPGTVKDGQFTPAYSSEKNNYSGLEPSVTTQSGYNHYLNSDGAIVVANKAATSLTLVFKPEYVKYIIDNKLTLTFKEEGVNIKSLKVLAVSSTGDKEYSVEGEHADDKLVSGISYEAFANVYGVAFSGGTSTGFDLVIGSGTFIPGFEDALIGLVKGNKKDVEISFPADYSNNARLKGQPVVFKVTINAVKEDAKYDDAFAKYMGYDTIEEYRQFIVDTMNKASFESQITEQLLKVCTVTKIPSKEIKEYKDNYASYYTSMAEYYVQLYSQYGYSATVEDILINVMGFSSTDQLYEVAEEYANNYLSTMYIIKEIARVEKISVTTAEFDKAALEYAQNNGYDTYEAFLAGAATKDEDKDEINDEINYIALLDKVCDFIIDKAVIKEADNSSSESTDK